MLQPATEETPMETIHYRYEPGIVAMAPSVVDGDRMRS